MPFPAAFNPAGFRSPPRPPAKKLQSLTWDGAVGAPHSRFEWLGWQRQAATRRIARGQGRNVLIVGAGPMGRKLAAILEREHIDGREVVGFLDESEVVAGDVLGRVKNLARIARREFVDEVILAIPDRRDLAKWVVREARRNRLNIRVVPDLYDFDCERPHEQIHEAGPLKLQYFGDVPVLTLHEETAPASGLFCKRVLDVTLSAVALLAAAPLLAAVAVAIKVASPGQVLYRAKRVGLKGRRFICYKFRTMVFDADQLKDGLRADNERRSQFFKSAAEHQITRVCSFSLRYHLG